MWLTDIVLSSRGVCLLSLLVILLLGCVRPVISEAFTSIAGLKTLVHNEDWLVRQLEDYISKEEERLERIRNQAKVLSSLTDLRKRSTEEEWEEHVTKLVEHPIGAFHVIKSWYQVSQLATTSTEQGYASVTSSATDRGISLPENHDYAGAITALIRLQKTYKLPSRDLAMGQVYNLTTAYNLDNEDLMMMAKMTMDVDHSLAMSWLELLLERIENDTETERQIYAHQINIYKQCEDFERAYIAAVKLFHLDPHNTFRQQEVEDLRNRVDEDRRLGKLPTQHYYWKSARDRGLEHYEALCRGDHITNTIFVNKDLICIYRRGVLPYIQYKEEIHSFSPRISLFIDVISDRQADMLKEKAFPSLYRAHVGDPSKSTITDERVSKLSWLWDTDPDVEKISRKVSHITGLDTSYNETLSCGEAFQIVNYGLGGQYEPHFDFYEETDMLERLPSFIMGTGDRIATFMFYLSDVQAGGATVFPSIGVRVPPIKNAAAFWYNFELSGTVGDRRTLHAGCPVLLGQKWVGNKWIRQLGQTFKRPCALNEYEADPIWYS